MELIVFQFGVPRIIVTDNGTQFVGKSLPMLFQNSKLNTSKHLLHILNPTDKCKYQIEQSYKASKNESTKFPALGSMISQTSFGHTGQPLDRQPVHLPSKWITESRQYHPSGSALCHQGLNISTSKHRVKVFVYITISLKKSETKHLLRFSSNRQRLLHTSIQRLRQSASLSTIWYLENPTLHSQQFQILIKHFES